MKMRVTDLEKFALEQIWRPYQNQTGYGVRLKSLPMNIDDTAKRLQNPEYSVWSALVFGRLALIGVQFASYLSHPLVDVVRLGVKRATPSSTTEG
jgi:hypothetical protein